MARKSTAPRAPRAPKAKPGGAPTPAVGALPAAPPVPAAAVLTEDRDAAIADALASAGVRDLSERSRSWLYQRIADHKLDAATMNLGGLRQAGIGRGKDLESFTSIGAAADMLVDIARRVGATAESPAPDIEQIGDLDECGQWHAYWRFGPYIDARGRNQNGWHRHPKNEPPSEVGQVFRNDQTPPTPLDVGWILLLGPDDEAKAIYAQLRADWAGFKAAGVGEGKLAFLTPDVESWNKFSAAWERSDLIPSALVQYHDSDLGPPAELGARLNAQVMAANRVRAEIATALTGKPITPGDLPNTRHGLKGPGSFFGAVAQWTDDTVKDVPLLGWLTDPKQTPEAAGKRIVTTAAIASAVVLVGAIAVIRALQPAPVRVEVRPFERRYA